MGKIVDFFENPIITVVIAPLAITVIVSICEIFLNKIMKPKIGIPYHIYGKKPVDVFAKHCEKKNIEPIVSYGEKEALKITTQIENGDVIVNAKINLIKIPKTPDTRNFVMILLKYVPEANLEYFYNKGYSFVFDIKSKSGIQGVQLEIKDINGGKVIDEFIKVTSISQHYSFKLNRYSSKEAWKEIQEICFTVFTEQKFGLKNKGNLEIRNCFLEVSKK